MTITCKSCNFPIQTSAEGYYLAESNVNFCVNCGKRYSDIGVNVNLLFQADKIRNNFQRKVRIWCFGLMMFCLMTGLLLSSSGIVQVDNSNFGIFLILALSPLVVIAAIGIWFIEVGGKKKFDKALEGCEK